MFGCPPQGEASILTGIPDFVSRIITTGLSPISGCRKLFAPLLWPEAAAMKK
jgi:hypothetical protein